MDTLKKAFHDIVLGYTFGPVRNKNAYIKHLSYIDQIDHDSRREVFFQEAKSQGLYTNEQRLESLKKEGAWTDKMERDITNSRLMMDGIVEGKKKNMNMPSLVKRYNEQLKEEEKKYLEKLAKKDQLLGLTCESYAERQVSDYYIYNNLFENKELTIPLFSEDEFDYFTDQDVSEVVDGYNKAIECCSDFNIKKLAMQGFFQSYFALTGDNLGQFFGKPIYQLTFFQVRLISYGVNFRNIFQNNDMSKFPRNVLDDPDLLIDYAVAAKKGREEMEKQGAYEGNAITVGMKKEDSVVLGVKNQNNLATEIAKQGGNVIDWVTKRG